jgi:L-threonylcarbamoyladenylate synthase
MQILKISSKNLKKVIKKAADVIKKGGVVICPTDTVYGLIADVKNSSAVRKIFEIKRRKSSKPFPVFVKDIKAAKILAFISQAQEKILKKFWPGKLTAIFKAKSFKFPEGIVSKDKKIGLRMPKYKLLNLLLRKLNSPLAETSANISGKKASTNIKEVLRQFKNEKYQPDLVLDAGNLKKSLPSTVIDMENLRILRKGQISKKEILKIAHEVKL